MRALRLALGVLGIAAILAIVGGPAAVASYNHAAKVAQRYGETRDQAVWLPLTTDGMLVAALIVMYVHRWRGEPVGRAPWFAFIAGTVATLAANLAAADLTAGSGDPWEIAGRLAVAVWPPIAFALTLELIAKMIEFLRPVAVDTPADVWPVTWRIGIPVFPYLPPVPEVPADVPADVPVPARARTRVPAVPVPAAPVRRTGTRKAGTPATNGKAVRWTEADELTRMELQNEIDAGTPMPSVRALKTRYGMSQDRAGKIRERLVVPAAVPAPVPATETD
jgi:hypothetical protein